MFEGSCFGEHQQRMKAAILYYFQSKTKCACDRPEDHCQTPHTWWDHCQTPHTWWDGHFQIRLEWESAKSLTHKLPPPTHLHFTPPGHKPENELGGRVAWRGVSKRNRSLCPVLQKQTPGVQTAPIRCLLAPPLHLMECNGSRSADQFRASDATQKNHTGAISCTMRIRGTNQERPISLA